MVFEEVTENVESAKDIKNENLRPFTLEIINIIKNAQQQHGLRHGDYQRYRGYCSRRIGRLRKVLKIPQGDRRHFKRRDVTDAHINSATADERFLQLPLMLAERSWAYAMQLRQEANTEQRKKFQMIRKLRKACCYALQLEQLCEVERCDARTKLEVQAYVAWMNGTLQFELQSWDDAAKNLKKAQIVYEKLASALMEEKQLPYKQRIEELTPSLRYCAYSIGDDKAVNLPELRTLGVLENFDKFILQSKEKVAAVLHTVKWYEFNIPIRNERVQMFLQTIINFDEMLAHAEDDSKRIQMIETMFIDLRDIITLVRNEVRSGDKDIQLLLAYLLSIRIERTIQRNMYLIKQMRKPQDIIRLLDIANQQLNDLKQLEPLQNQEKVQITFDNRLLGYRALRCFYLGKCHSSFHRWPEAYGCLERSNKYTIEALKNDIPTELKKMLTNTLEEIQSEMVSVRAHSILEQKEIETTVVTSHKSHKNKKPLIERLDEFHENPQYLTKNPNIVTMPPAMQPVPAKPLFYDLALNFVNFPSLADKVEEGQSKQKQTGGISGFVKGIWGGWGGSSKK